LFIIFNGPTKLFSDLCAPYRKAGISSKILNPSAKSFFPCTTFFQSVSGLLLSMFSKHFVNKIVIFVTV